VQELATVLKSFNPQAFARLQDFQTKTYQNLSKLRLLSSFSQQTSFCLLWGSKNWCSFLTTVTADGPVRNRCKVNDWLPEGPRLVHACEEKPKTFRSLLTQHDFKHQSPTRLLTESSVLIPHDPNMASVSMSHSRKRAPPRSTVSETALRRTGYNKPSPGWPAGKESPVDRILLITWHELRKY